MSSNALVLIALVLIALVLIALVLIAVVLIAVVELVPNYLTILGENSSLAQFEIELRSRHPPQFADFLNGLFSG